MQSAMNTALAPTSIAFSITRVIHANSPHPLGFRKQQEAPAARVLFPVGEQRLFVRLSWVLGARMPTYKREATEDRTSNYEDRGDERNALDEHAVVSLDRLVIVTTRAA